MVKRSKASDDSLESLPNIGKVIAGKLRQIGIETKSDFLKRDPFKVFDILLKKCDPTLCRCALASIVGASVGSPWHEITKESAKEFAKRHPRHKWGKC
ncbi:MAG: helix-hairpin-helix domain-containing protein [Candidatus Margulisbacteria bacterium]|nr:helix-hairpin-helix domain-containing protein [Candidatus Margulisiibacteriota bacterium]